MATGNPAGKTVSGRKLKQPRPDEIARQEDFRRMQYRTVLGFDPSLSWSNNFSLPVEEERIGGRKRSTSKGRSPFRKVDIDIDHHGNYILNQYKTQTSPAIYRPTAATKSPKTQEQIMLQKIRRDQWKLERINESMNLRCAMCREKVLEKDISLDRKFGILPNCEDVFCLSCIAKCGKRGNCPLCNAKYYQIIPCRFFVRCERQKEKMLAAIMEGRRFFEDEGEVDEKRFMTKGWLNDYPKPRGVVEDENNEDYSTDDADSDPYWLEGLSLEDSSVTTSAEEPNYVTSAQEWNY